MARIRIQSPVCLLPLLCCLILSALPACNRETRHAGIYIAETRDSSHRQETTLELKEDGGGVWRVGEDEVGLSWYVKGNELRLHTRDGGVIVGKLDGKFVHVSLPGPKDLFFKKVK